MKLFKLWKNFKNDESGAVTVDWVVLTAALVGLDLDVVIGPATTHQEPALLLLDLAEAVIEVPGRRDAATQQPRPASTAATGVTAVIEVQAGTQPRIEQGLAGFGVENMGGGSDSDLVRHTRGNLTPRQVHAKSVSRGVPGPAHTTRGAALLSQDALCKARGERFGEPKRTTSNAA